MSKKVVAIVGSYRKGHIIDTLVSEVLKGAEQSGAEVEKINLLDKHIEFCTNCRSCTQGRDVDLRGKCIHDDDMAEILEKLEAADAIVLGSPVNFGYVTAITKRFMERLIANMYWPWEKGFPVMRKSRKEMPKKPAVIVTASACPAFIGRFLMGQPKKALKMTAGTLGSRVQSWIYVGMIAKAADQKPGQKSMSKAFAAGQRLA